MALPKRRHSNHRTRLRRTHYKLSPPTLATCPRCREPKMPHHACLACGFYNGRMVLSIKEKQKKAE